MRNTYKNLKTFAWILILPVLAFAGCDQQAGTGNGGGKRTIKIGTVLPDDHPTVEAMKIFGERLTELSNENFTVQLYPNSQLGGATEMVEALLMGNLEMAVVSAVSLSEHTPLYDALSMPFIFRDPEHQAMVLDGEIGEKLKESAKPANLHVLGFLDAGSRNISTKQGPIVKPADLRGMTIRVMDSKLMIDSINAMGASAVAMNQGDVYTSLQQGVLDGWENNPPTVVSFRMYETGCIYFAWTRHFSIPDVLLSSTSFYEGLSEEEKKWVDEAAADMVTKQRELWKEYEEKALEIMVENGMKINEVDFDAFKATADPIYEEYYRKHGEEFKALSEAIRNET